MNFQFALPGGTQMKLLTAGKYCDRDILVTGKGYTDTDLQESYDRGKTDGLDAGVAICATKHFVHGFVGDGSNSVSFYVPFEPDAVWIIGFDPTYNKAPYALGSFCYDRRAFGFAAGIVQYGLASGSSTSQAMTTKTALNRYSRTEDGTITISNLHSTSPVVFYSGYVYTVVAVKYTEQTDTERITDFVNQLENSGTVTLNQAKVEAAFTEDQWAALIATKPDWTFTWI